MYWKIIRHLPLIIAFIDIIKEIISEAVNNKSVDKRLIKTLFDKVQELLRKGVIDIPGVDEHAVADWLQGLEDKLFSEENK